MNLGRVGDTPTGGGLMARWLFVVVAGCAPPLELVAVTFNTGTTEAIAGGDGDGYGPEQAAISDAWYGDGLAWSPVVDDVRRWFEGVDADVVGFQELFWSEVCAEIPAEAHAGFVCEGWSPGDPTVARMILGDGWQVACHEGKWDKCIAVRDRLGTIAGCAGDLCMDALDGAEVDGCGSGSRVGRATVDLAGGGSLTVVNVHGSSGFSAEDEDCRLRQFRLVWDDMDGQPAANGDRNVVLGDFNTDPVRNAGGDDSAAWVLARVVDPWAFVTAVGEDAPRTYGGLLTIDHVVSDSFDGACWHAGITEGHPAVSEISYLDHVPAVCALAQR